MGKLRLPLLLLALAGIAQGAGAAIGHDGATDRVIIKWRDRAALPAAAALEKDVRELALQSGVRLTRLRSIGAGMHVLRLEHEMRGEELAATLRQLRSDPQVAFAESDRRVHAHAFAPSDPLFINQWYLQGTQAAAIHADEAWDVTHGGAAPSSATTVVAVIDTGVRYEHPDLLRSSQGGKLLPGYDFVSADRPGVFTTANDGDGWDADPSDPGDWVTSADIAGQLCTDDEPSDSSWHGTRVSGLIAANTDNGAGIAGAAFHVAVLPVRALGKCGGFESDVLAAMFWAAGLPIPLAIASTVPATNPHPADIINMSLGGTGPCSIQYRDAVNQITARGVLIVASAGNEGAPVDAPANCAGVLAVGGLRHVGTKVGYSNLGAQVGISAPAGNCVNIAPGSLCLFSLDTTTDLGTTVPAGSGYTDQIHSNVGTSFSAPLASATAALMHAVNSQLTPAQLIARIKSSAVPFPTMSDTTPQPPVCHVPTGSADLQNLECICNTAVCGAGMLDTAGAVNAALRPAPTVTQTGTNSPGRTLTLDGAASGAADGRSIVSYAWSVAATTGGAATPVFGSPTQSATTVAAPATGSYTVRLTVGDSAGASEFTDVTITAASGGGGVTGTVEPQASGGGGAMGVELLLLAALLGRRMLQARRRVS